MRSVILPIISLSLVAAIGCDSKPKTTGGPAAAPDSGRGAPAAQPANASEKEETKLNLQQLSLAMYFFHDANGRPPTSIGDLKPQLLEGGERVVKAVESGQLVVNWGAPVTTKWHAYEKDAPIRGGQITVWNEDKRQMIVQDLTAAEVKKIIGK
jgi:hypothetical protein